VLQFVEALLYLLKLLNTSLDLYGPDDKRVKDLTDHGPVSGVLPTRQNVLAELDLRSSYVTRERVCHVLGVSTSIQSH